MPELAVPVRDKRQRYAAYAERALNAMRDSVVQLADSHLRLDIQRI
jgi:folate-dependent tRNA-U54 methylase TrmFO/GidA